MLLWMWDESPTALLAMIRSVVWSQQLDEDPNSRQNLIHILSEIYPEFQPIKSSCPMLLPEMLVLPPFNHVAMDVG